jgi:predicted acyl esterase
LGGFPLAAAEPPAVEPLQPVVAGIVEEHVMLPMRDGVRLSCYLTRPAEGGPWPVLYQQRYSDVSSEGARRHAATLALHGYAVCVQNFRGAQKSDGPFDGYRSLGWGERQDGFDTVAWLAKQPWSNGKVGTYGGSQAGYAQNFLAVTQPPALVCQYMTDTGLSLFHEGYRIGGATRPARLYQGMGLVAKQKNGRQWVESMLAHPTYDDYWAAEDCTKHFDKMNVPCFTVGSWFDFMNTGSVQSFIGRQHHGGANSRGKQEIVIGPWLHGGSKAGGAKIGDLTIPENAGFDLTAHMLQWFDRHLKGIDVRAKADPAVRYYVMGAIGESGAPGNEWRAATDFPPPADHASYYLHADGKLETIAPADAASRTTYRSDPAHPAPMPGRAYTAARDGRAFESHPDVRSFTTAELTEPTEWTGLVRAELFVSSTAPDSDFIVRVSDVYPDGRSIMLVESIKRARYRDGYDREVPLPAGKPVPVTIDVGWLSQIFNRGHRIRVSVSSTGADFYEPNPQTGEPATFDPPAKVLIAENAVYHEAAYASRIVAPVPRVVAESKPGAARVDELLNTIAQVGPQGTGSTAARIARDELARNGLEILPQLFLAMDTRNVVALNWYRTVYEEIVIREQASSSAAWPTAFLETYLNDRNRSGRARRLALSLIEKLDPNFLARWLPSQHGDPEFGFEAAELALAAGTAAQKAKDVELAKAEFHKAFVHARDSKQVSQAAAKLKSLGESPDVLRRLGLVVNWRKVATFDAPDRTGFAVVYEPEKQLTAMQTRQNPFTAAEWIEAKCVDGLGQLDLNDAFGVSQEKVGYVVAEIDVPREQAAEVRCGADDNCTVWLNGVKVFGREQWLNGTRFDRFIAPINLAAGRNVLLVKVCQGPHHRDPEVPNNWSLQLRLCDAGGQGIDFTPITAPTISNARPESK